MVNGFMIFPRFLPAGDRALLVEFDREINPTVYKQVRRLYHILQAAKWQGIEEVVPAYSSLLIYYEPLVVSFDELIARLTEIIADGNEELALPEPLVYLIPVVYGGEFGPDLEFVAVHNGLTVEEVIALHSSVDYLIYMLGFTPGFPYLGGMPAQLSTPRLEQPRARVPAGSVGIAGEQTGIYPLASPGGWRIIGRTPLVLYDPHREPPVLLKAGNYLRFIPITPAEYEEIERQVKEGSYQLQIVNKEGAACGGK